MSSMNILKAGNSYNLEATGAIIVCDLATGLEVARYEGLEVHRALMLARYIVDASFGMINVEPPCAPEVIEKAQAIFDTIFREQDEK